MLAVDRLQRRALLAASWLGHRAAWREAAALRHVGEVRGLSLDRRQRLASAAKRRQAIEEADRVRMARAVEDVAGPSELDDAPGVHHGHSIAELGDDPEIVRDEDECQARLPLDLLQEAQILRLDRDVERGRGLVGDQQARLAGDRDRAGDPLADATAHLVRIGVHPPLRIADLHLAQELDDPVVEGAAAQPAMEREGLGDLLPHGHRGIQRGHGILQDHRDPRSPQAAHLFRALVEEVLAVEEDLAPDDPPARLGHEPQDRETRHRLARARLADDAEGLAAADREARAVDGLHDPAARVDVGAEVPHLQERVGHGRLRPAGASDRAGRGPSRRGCSARAP